MRVLFLLRSDTDRLVGGTAEQLRRYAQAVTDHGGEPVLHVAHTAPPGRFDVAHVFNVDWPLEAAHHMDLALRAADRVVLSPVHHRRELGGRLPPRRPRRAQPAGSAPSSDWTGSCGFAVSRRPGGTRCCGARALRQLAGGVAPRQRHMLERADAWLVASPARDRLGRRRLRRGPPPDARHPQRRRVGRPRHPRSPAPRRVRAVRRARRGAQEPARPRPGSRGARGARPLRRAAEPAAPQVRGDVRALRRAAARADLARVAASATRRWRCSGRRGCTRWRAGTRSRRWSTARRRSPGARSSRPPGGTAATSSATPPCTGTPPPDTVGWSTSCVPRSSGRSTAARASGSGARSRGNASRRTSPTRTASATRPPRSRARRRPTRHAASPDPHRLPQERVQRAGRVVQRPSPDRARHQRDRRIAHGLRAGRAPCRAGVTPTLVRDEPGEPLEAADHRRSRPPSRPRTRSGGGAGRGPRARLPDAPAPLPGATILIVTRGFRGVRRSGYSQYVKSGGHLTTTELRAAHPRREPSGLDYDAVVALYERHFGRDNVIVLPYELLRDDPAAFTGALEQRLELRPGLAPVPRRNPSLTPGAVVWQRRLSRLVRICVRPLPRGARPRPSGACTWARATRRLRPAARPARAHRSGNARSRHRGGHGVGAGRARQGVVARRPAVLRPLRGRVPQRPTVGRVKRMQLVVTTVVRDAGPRQWTGWSPRRRSRDRRASRALPGADGRPAARRAGRAPRRAGRRRRTATGSSWRTRSGSSCSTPRGACAGASRTPRSAASTTSCR